MKELVKFVCAIVLFSKASAYPSPPQDIQTVNFCTVVNSPQNYDGHVILTSGVLLPGEHSLSFYDPACKPSAANKVSAQGVLETSAVPTKLVRKLHGFFRHRYAAKVRVEGTFYSTGGPFGADSARFRFSIQELQSVDREE